MENQIYQFLNGNIVHCGAKHGRVAEQSFISWENAARNILGVGLPRQKNGQVGQHKTTAKVVVACEMSTRREATARYQTQCLTAGENLN